MNKQDANESKKNQLKYFLCVCTVCVASIYSSFCRDQFVDLHDSGLFFSMAE